MKLKQLLSMFLLMLMAVLLVSCAGSQEDETPAPAEEVSGGPSADSVAMYSREEADQAVADAETAIAEARDHGGDPAQQQAMLEDARLALEAEDVSRAVELAMAAEHGARQVASDAMLEQARVMVAKVRDSEAGGQESTMERITEVETAIQIGNGELAFEMATNLYDDIIGVGERPMMTEAQEVTPAELEREEQEMVASSEPVPMANEQVAEIDVNEVQRQAGADSYKVVRGDSLWDISAKPVIYNNPYQWPLIYKTNKHQIKDPDLIYPGQNLDIDRNASRAEIDAAVHHARTRGKWSLGDVEVADTRYLKNSDRASVAAR